VAGRCEVRVVLTATLEVGATVETSIERVAHGGEGVGQVEGLVVFVPWTAPGERVRAEIVERKPRWARARLIEVIEASPLRVTPGCPVFGTCGGCQLQHLGSEDQRRVKAQAVADALARIAQIDIPATIECQPAAAPWHYRQRATFTWRWDGERLELGFHAAALPRDRGAPHELVDVHACPIFAEVGNRRLGALSEGLAAGLADELPIEGRLAIRALGGRPVDGGVFAPEATLAERLATRCSEGAGIDVTWGRWRTGVPLACDPRARRLHARIVYRGLNLRVGFDSFVQADLHGASRLYDVVLEELACRPGTRVIDGYAGVGVVACELARCQVQVTAVEAHPGAAADLRANTAGVANASVHVLELPAERVDWARPHPDAILLNPPRTGCPPRVLEGIARSSARRLVYVSCEPTTLARDVRRLGTAWRLESVRAFDLFPQTAHVETIVRLERP
jgi:23S rRNA (uracil1939-C5)-methyltransferase